MPSALKKVTAEMLDLAIDDLHGIQNFREMCEHMEEVTRLFVVSPGNGAKEFLEGTEISAQTGGEGNRSLAFFLLGWKVRDLVGQVEGLENSKLMKDGGS